MNQKSLLIVESPTKVKTIQQELDTDRDRLSEVLEKMQNDGLVKLNTNNLVEINPG